MTATTDADTLFRCNCRVMLRAGLLDTPVVQQTCIQIGLAPWQRMPAQARSLFPRTQCRSRGLCAVSLSDRFGSGTQPGQLRGVAPQQASVPSPLPSRAGCAFCRLSAFPVGAVSRPGIDNHGRYRLSDLTTHVDSIHMTDMNATVL